MKPHNSRIGRSITDHSITSKVDHAEGVDRHSIGSCVTTEGLPSQQLQQQHCSGRGVAFAQRTEVVVSGRLERQAVQ